MKFPLSPIPLAIAHADGERRKTNKSSLYDHALSSSQSSECPHVDGSKAYVLDLAAQLRSIIKVPDTFEALAMQLLNGIPNAYKKNYIACDTYRDLSIKFPERKLRGASQKLLLRSAKVRIPPDFKKILCNGDNKERLFQLIEDTWIKNKEMISDRFVYFARGDLCMAITSEGAEEIPQLKTNHEEADTKIAYLVDHAITNGASEVCIRSTSGDIDIPVILVGAFGLNTEYIFVDNGTGKNRKRVRIDSSTLSLKQQKALVGFHAFTGNDYVSSFMRKSKRVWKTVEKDNTMLDFLGQLGEGQLTDETHKEAKKFVCTMYGDKRVQNVNELRGKLFWSRLRKNGKVPDLSLLPPCASTLRRHSARAHYVAKIWKQACSPLQHIDSFSNNGWLPDGSVDWIERAYPSDVESLFIAAVPENDVNDDDGDDDDNVDDDFSDEEDNAI